MGGKIYPRDRKIIAAFDFDGTITKSDTLPIFIWHAVTIKQFLLGCLSAIPFFALYKLKFITNHNAKERLFTSFFKGITLQNLNFLSTDFIKKIDDLVHSDALKKIEWHQKMGHEVIIVSASAENWILPWAEKNNIKTVLATKFEVKDGVLTGKFLNKNCHGPEKVCRILEAYPDRSNYILYAYGDSNGDTELLELADHSFYRSFN